MTAVIAFTVFCTVTAGLYLSLSRDIFRCVIGLAVLGAAANLVLFAAGRLDSPLPAVVPAGDQVLTDAANPLPQALVLTAIVIGFALTSFFAVLIKRVFIATGTDDTDILRSTET